VEILTNMIQQKSRDFDVQKLDRVGKPETHIFFCLRVLCSVNALCDVLCAGQFYGQFAMQVMLHVGIHFIDVEVRFPKLLLSFYPCFLSFHNVESYVSKSYVLSYVLKITTN
jgi:hypothetical protein